MVCRNASFAAHKKKQTRVWISLPRMSCSRRPITQAWNHGSPLTARAFFRILLKPVRYAMAARSRSKDKITPLQSGIRQLGLELQSARNLGVLADMTPALSERRTNRTIMQHSIKL
jgi:hypothetical protein